jgi:adenine-specific DNA methylase
MMLEAKLLARQLLAAIRELVEEIRELRKDIKNQKTRTGGE